MPKQNKSMDFFRPTHSTDPLLDRPTIKSVSTPVQKAKKSASSTRPALRQKSGAVPKLQPARSVSKSSVSVQKTVIKKTSDSSATVTSAKTTITSTTKSPKPSAPVSKSQSDDEWLDSLEKNGFLSDEKSKGKVSYPFGGESPFLKSVKVEKRPLSSSIPEKNPYDNFNATKKAPAPRRDPVRIVNKSKKKSNALSLTLIIIITIILGAAAGVGVFFLIAQ